MCEQNVWAAGGRQDHRHTLQERQGSVLTNQCLGKKMDAERGAEKWFLMDSDEFYSEETPGLALARVLPWPQYHRQ